jgi:hypothetical protein
VYFCSNSSDASKRTFFMFSCPIPGIPPVKYQVSYFFQEIPTPLPGCGGRVFCPYEWFRAYMASFVDSCDLEEICYTDSVEKLRKQKVR